MASYKYVALIFLLLASIVTIYPPYRWGEERLGTEGERRRPIARGSSERVTDALPIKQYDFLFGDSKKQFQVGWEWDDVAKRNAPIYLTLERRLITTELILEYLLALILSCTVSLVLTIIQTRRTSRQISQQKLKPARRNTERA